MSQSVGQEQGVGSSLHDLFGVALHESEFFQAVVKLRCTKEPQEIEAIERACEVGYKMHTKAMQLVRPGLSERFIAGQVDGIARSYAQGISFATIFSQHGEIMHGAPPNALLEEGRLVLCDAGCELDAIPAGRRTRELRLSRRRLCGCDALYGNAYGEDHRGNAARH